MSRKRICSILLMLVLSLTLLAGCGDKDESKKKKEKMPSIVKGSVAEMLDAMIQTDSGTARLELTAGKQTVAVDFSFDRKTHDFNLGLKAAVKGKEIKNDFFITKDNVEYINLEAILDVIAALDSADKVPDEVRNIFKGWLALPLPKDLPDEFYAAGKASAFTNLFTKLVNALNAEGSDGDYTITAKTKDDYKKLLQIAQEFAEKDLRKNLSAGADRLAAIQKMDCNAYVKDLIEFYKDDLYALVRQYGDRLGVTEDQLSALLDEAKRQDYNALLEEYMKKTAITGEETDKLLDDISQSFINILADSQEDLEKTESFPEAIVRVSADDKGYTAEFTVKSLDNAVKGAEEVIGGDVKVVFRLVPGSSDVSKPSEIASVKTVADMLIPSYTRYVEKSRGAADGMFLQDAMRCTEVLAADPEFAIPAGSKFTLEIDNGRLTVSVKDQNGKELTEVEEEWKNICVITEQPFKSTEITMAKGRLVGVVQEKYKVSWTKEDTNSAFEAFLSSVGSFARFFN
ncbi:MAG: hypothetical protein K6E71_07600 [Lachnospiraceae bacterium]|nr:hypothetical protein [Lachnospiraceae bacterium]